MGLSGSGRVSLRAFRRSSSLRVRKRSQHLYGFVPPCTTLCALCRWRDRSSRDLTACIVCSFQYTALLPSLFIASVLVKTSEFHLKGFCFPDGK